MFGPIHLGTSGDETKVQNYLYHIWDPENGTYDKLIMTSGDSPRDGSPVDFGSIANLGTATFPQIVMMGFGRAAFAGGPATPPHQKAYPCCFYPQIYDHQKNKLAGLMYTSLQCVRSIGVTGEPSGSPPPDADEFKRVEYFPYSSVPHHSGYYWFTVSRTITQGPTVKQSSGYATPVNVSGNTFQVAENGVFLDQAFTVTYNDVGYSHSLSYTFALQDMLTLGTGFTFVTLSKANAKNMRAPIPKMPSTYGNTGVISTHQLFAGTANSITFLMNDPLSVSYPYGVVGFPGWVTDFWTDDDIGGNVPNLLSARNHWYNDWGPTVAWGFLYQDSVWKAMTFVNSSYWSTYKSSLLIQDHGYLMSAIFLNTTDWDQYTVKSPLYSSNQCSGFFYPRVLTDDPGGFSKSGVTIVSGASTTDEEYPATNGFSELYTEAPKSNFVAQSLVEQGSIAPLPGVYDDYPHPGWDFQVGMGTFGHSSSQVVYYPFFLLRGIARVCAVVEATPQNGNGVTHDQVTVLNTELHSLTITSAPNVNWWGTNEADIVTRSVIGLCGPDYQSFYGTESTLQDSKFIYSDDQGETWSNSAVADPPYPPTGYAFRAGNSASGFVTDGGEVWVTEDRGRSVGRLLDSTEIGWVNNIEVIGYSEILTVGDREILYPAPVTCPATSEEEIDKKWICKSDLSTEIYANTQYPVQTIEWVKFRTNYHKGSETGEQVELERWATIDPKYYSVVRGESTRIAITTKDGDTEIVPSWCYLLKIKYTPVTSCTALNKLSFGETGGTERLCILPSTSNGFGMDIHPNQIGWMVDYDPAAANVTPLELVARRAYAEYTCFIGLGFHMSPYATGGVDPFKWTAVGLPPGLSIAESGNITGTATTEGTYNVTATVEDSQSPKKTSSVSFTILVRKQAL